MSDTIRVALEEMETERAGLLTRLRKLETCIASIRQSYPSGERQGKRGDTRIPLVGGEHSGESKKRPRGRPPGPKGKMGRPQRPVPTEVPANVLSALKAGPMRVGELEVGLKVPRLLLQRLVRSGLLVAHGSTSQRRIGLPSSTAKEAP